MALFKEHFSAAYVDNLIERLNYFAPNIQTKYLEQTQIIIESLEMKDRVNNIADAIFTALEQPASPALAENLTAMALGDNNYPALTGFDAWPIFSIFERHFINEFEAAMTAFYKLTHLFTAEFAIRPFIFHYPEPSFALFSHWSQDESEQIRRLSSEGIRPNLPWGGKIHYLNKNPKKIIAILNRLKNDPSLYVRKSVANNFNDISKEHSQIILDNFKKWQANRPTAQQQWIMKHALRSLIKQGDKQALALVGVNVAGNIKAVKFSAAPKAICLGQEIELSLELQNNDNHDNDVMVDYIIHHVKANGQTTPKVFKWKKFNLKAEQNVVLVKSHKILPITTRKYYAGKHGVQILVNGNILADSHFELII
ncbi:MAG: DNA alkylation repair protein [Alphaproteobacteria bacterium]